jgi:antitoxin MazE
METKIAKWGNSLGIRLPKSIVQDADLHEGDSISISVGRQRKLVLVPKRRRPTLDELVAGITEENRYEEIPKGPPRGREEW